MPLRARTMLLAGCLLMLLACLLPTGAVAAKGRDSQAHATGGTSPDDPRFAPAKKAKIVNGIAVPPRTAPPEVVAVIDAANEIVRKPYRYGGGHQSFEDTGYDCSGSVSYALHGGGLLRTPMDSSGFMSYGLPGRGKHITIYAHPGHVYMVIDGRRFDTSARRETGSRWTSTPRSTAGYTVRHPPGL